MKGKGAGVRSKGQVRPEPDRSAESALFQHLRTALHHQYARQCLSRIPSPSSSPASKPKPDLSRPPPTSSFLVPPFPPLTSSQQGGPNQKHRPTLPFSPSESSLRIQTSTNTGHVIPDKRVSCIPLRPAFLYFFYLIDQSRSRLVPPPTNDGTPIFDDRLPSFRTHTALQDHG
jgi:hypothetical protein